MKKVEAIVNADQVDNLRTALQCVGILDIQVTEIQGFIRPSLRKTNINPSLGLGDWFVPKCKVDLCVMDEALRQTARIIFLATKARAIVDGRLFCDSVLEADPSCA
ncbi:MAG: P-II family nitrogen regulator [Pirellulaceae bacterium]